MNDATKLWVFLGVFLLCPALGVAGAIHGKLKKRRLQEARTLIHEARVANKASVDLQAAGAREAALTAKAAADETQQKILRVRGELVRWKQTNAAALERYAKLSQTFTPNGAALLLDERLTLPDLIERLTRDALEKQKGFTGLKVARRARGFEVTLTFKNSLEWSEKTQIMAAIRRLKATLDPAWIGDLRFSKLGGTPVSVGPFDRLSDSRLSTLMATYYTTKSVRLPDPNIVGRRNHPEAAWMIKNGTSRNIAITYFGPEQGTINLVPKQSKEIKFKPGSYFISVKATDGGSNVTPYSGQTNYKGGYLYSSEWIIRTSYGPGTPTFPYRPRKR